MTNPSSANAALHAAVVNNDPVAVAAALDNGAEVDKPIRGTTVLFCAVIEARPDIVALLLERGADVRKRDRESGWTPLEMAMINMHRSPRRHFTGRAVKDSRKVVAILTNAAGNAVPASPVIGTEADEESLVASIRAGAARRDTRIMSCDGAVVVPPKRMTSMFGEATFDTLESFARQRKLQRVLAALA